MTEPAAKVQAARPVRPAAPVHAASLARTRAGTLQRCGAASGPGCPCHKEDSRGVVQRSPSGGTATGHAAHSPGPGSGGRSPGAATAVPAIVSSVLASPGRGLDGATRSRMEARLGRDLGHVRVHTDARAGESARAVAAHAYTVGPDVVFGHGRYAPGSPSGDRLLAHELVHTLQQGGLQRSAAADLSLDGTAAYASLEHEADAVADAALAGRAGHGVSAAPAAGPILSRAADDGPAAPRPIPGAERQELPAATRARLEQLGVTSILTPVAAPAPAAAPLAGGPALGGPTAGPRLAAFSIRSFPLPEQKGPRAFAAYDAAARANQLRATIRFAAGRRSTGQWQSRAGTQELRDSWLRKVGWAPAAAATRWADLGGVAGQAGAAFAPRVGTVTCDLDHVIELQLIGTNVAENVQVLDPGPNRSSGSTIARYLNTLAQDIRDTFPDSALPDEVTLHFESVVQEGAPACAPPDTRPAASCVQIECAASTGGPAAPSVAPPAGGVLYRLYAGSQGANVYVLATAQTDLEGSAVPENANVADLVSGFRLLRYRKAATAGRPDAVAARVDVGRLTGRARESRVLGALQVLSGGDRTFDGVPGEPEGANPRRALQLRAEDRALRFHYPYLSNVDLHLAHTPEAGLTGTGTMRSDVPLLNRAQFGVTLGDGRLRAELRGRPTAPIPGVRVTEAVVEADLLPELGLQGRLGFEFGPSGRPVAAALLTLSADAAGPVAEGRVDLRVPWVDDAHGTLTYRDRAWSGEIVVATEQIRNRIPAVRDASVVVRFGQAGMTATGHIGLEVRPGQTVDLEAHYANGRWVFTGDGRFTVPMLDPVLLHLRYDGEHLTGRGETGFTLHGLAGHIVVVYDHDRFTGEGTLSMNRGRMTGTIHAHLLPSGVITADGTVSYAIRPDLVATVGVDVDERQRVRLSGDLTFARPVPLFGHFGSNRELFRSRTDIPIFGISVGPVSVGLVGRLEGWLTVDYGIGPGELRNLRLHGALNPLEDDPNIELSGTAQLYIPASAGFGANVRGAIALSAGIASVSGGITASGRLGLEAHAAASLDIAYANRRFTVDSVAELIGRPVLALGLEANVEAEAGVGPLTYRYHKGWQLARFELGSDLEFGIRAPFHYASDEPFRAPTVDQLEFVRPDIDVGRTMRQMFDRVAA